MIAVPIYALFPVAPPRLAGIGIIDTISDKSETSLNSHVATSFYNPFAAVPSLHVGFAFAVGIALAVAARRWWSRTLALLWGPTVALAVVATGNHFLFDIAAGLLVAAAGFLVGRAASRHCHICAPPGVERVTSQFCGCRAPDPEKGRPCRSKAGVRELRSREPPAASELPSSRSSSSAGTM
jgi:hypothetical protein